jgi:hypothetical protein
VDDRESGESDGDKQPCHVASKHTRRLKRRRKNIIADDDDESEEEQNGDDGSDVESGWKIAGIIEERILFDGHGFQRQYWVRRADDEFTTKRNSPTKFTNAVTHDKTDMPPSVLNAWRAQQPLSKLRWIYGGKEKESSAKVKKILKTHQAKWEKQCNEMMLLP